MARMLDEWIGRDDDEAVPPRVRVRVFDRFNGRCHKCTRKIFPEREPWTCEHLVAICNQGKNRESNLGVTCCNCLPEKNAEDLAEKSSVYGKRARHLGVQTKPKWRWGWKRA